MINSTAKYVTEKANIASQIHGGLAYIWRGEYEMAARHLEAQAKEIRKLMKMEEGK